MMNEHEIRNVVERAADGELNAPALTAACESATALRCENLDAFMRTRSAAKKAEIKASSARLEDLTKRARVLLAMAGK